jgi:hypothetical protein
MLGSALFSKLRDPKFWLLSLLKERPIWTDFRKYFLVHVLRINEVWVLFTDRHHEQHALVLPEGYYASPKRIVKALEAMKHQKGFSLGMSEVDHKATLWAKDLSQVIISPLLKSFLGFDKLNWNTLSERTQCVLLVVSIREQYPYFVYAYAVPAVRILCLCQSYLPGSIQI